MPIQQRHPSKEATREPSVKHIDCETPANKTRKIAPSPSRKRGAPFFLLAGVFSVLLFIKFCISNESDFNLKLGVQQESENRVQPSSDDVNSQVDCSNILLYLEDKYAINGIGCQLNNYVLATIMAMYTNRSLVIVSNNRFKILGGGSQFGCPSGNAEADEASLPFGLSRLLKTPEWLGGGCHIPCIDSYDYDYWDRASGSRGENSTICTNGDGRNVSVLPLDADGIRGFAMDEFYMKRSVKANTTTYSDFYARLGATPSEIEWLSTRGSITWHKKELWDQLVSLLNRKGMMIFQPWMRRDARTKVKQANLPEHYIAVHVRRGDKLKLESKDFVQEWWKERGYNATTQPKNYIPFSFYMEQLEKDPPILDLKTIYVATDDPAVVKEEIGNLTNARGYSFVMNPDDTSSTGHLQTGQDCQERYRKTVVAIADIIILSEADIFVGEFSSNWGRLIRTWRTSLKNNTIGTGSPRDIRQTFGNWQPPGW